jgi:hypothetical protein
MTNPSAVFGCPMFFCAELEGRVLNDILDLFYGATRMVININKSAIFFPELEEDLRLSISTLFSFPSYDLQDGIKYLGFKLKPNNYGTKDWK